MANQAYIGGANNSLSFAEFQPSFSQIVPGPRTQQASTETDVAYKLDAAGVSSLLQVYMTGNAQASAGTATSRKNTALGNQTISITAATTGLFQDTTHSDSLAKGDTQDVQITAPTTSTFTVSVQGVLFSGTSVVAGFFNCQDAGNSGTTVNGGTASSTKFLPVMGAGDNSNPLYQTTESIAQEQVVSAGTLSRLGTRVPSNTSTNTMSWVFRKNTTSGSQTITITGTGYIEDTTHTDAIVGGDLVDISSTTGAGTVNAAARFNIMTLTSGSSALDLRQGNTRTAGQGFSSTVATFMAIGACNITAFATEAQIQTQIPFAGTFSDLIATVSATSGTGAQPMTFRVGGSNGNQTISINPASTGTTHDVTHTDAVTLNALVNLRMAAIGASGTLAFSMIGVTFGGATNVSVSLTGVQATGVARGFAPSVASPLSGVHGTGAARSLSGSHSPALVGVRATAAARALSPQISIPLTGVHATGGAGTFAPSKGIPITGVHAIGIARALTAEVAPTLLGVRSQGQAGNLSINTIAAPTSRTRVWGTYR